MSTCQKIGVDVSDSGYQSIRETLIGGKGDFHFELQNLAVQEAMSRHSRKDGF